MLVLVFISMLVSDMQFVNASNIISSFETQFNISLTSIICFQWCRHLNLKREETGSDPPGDRAEQSARVGSDGQVQGSH